MYIRVRTFNHKSNKIVKELSKVKFNYLIAMLFFSISSCKNSKNIKLDKHKIDISEVPVFQEGDEKFANVYKGLDGKWKGEFTILEDPNPVNASEVELNKLSIEQIRSPKLKTINKIEVEQVYTSESPYFQKVVITDYYPETGKTEISEGVNKIEKGEMWCIVNKPNETIVHSGKTEGNHTIIWSQNNQNPQRVEYFQEEVSEHYYEIIGYGYYEGDDINLSPRLWFYGKYERQ